MGIMPYHSPSEWIKLTADIQHGHDFITQRGYTDCYTEDWRGRRVRTTPFLAPNGVRYDTAQQMYEGYGKYPTLQKDGVCYNYYEALRLEGYVNPWDDENEFLKSLGYEKWVPPHEDYLEQNKYLKDFYEKWGFVPRWIESEGGKISGHQELLDLHSYIYLEWKKRLKRII